MIDRGGAGHVQPIGLRLGDDLQGQGRGDERGMVARAGQVHEPDVAIEHDGFRLARGAGKPEARGEFAFVHDALGGKIAVLGVMDDERIEVARVLHHPAQDAGVADRPRAVTEGHGTRLEQQADLGDFRAVETHRQGRGGQHPHAAGIARAAQQEIDDCWLINWRRGVGAGEDRRDAARRCRRCRCRDRLAMFGAGLADENPHVDKPRRHAIAAAIDDAGMRRQIGGHDGGANIADQAIDDKNAAVRL